MLRAKKVELGDDPALARDVAVIFVAERALSAFRVDRAIEVIGGINGNRRAIVVGNGGTSEATVGFGGVEAGMPDIENERVTNFVVRDGKEIVGFVAEISRRQPIIVIGEKQPAKRVVVAVNLRFKAARAMHPQWRAPAGLRPSVKAGFAAGTVQAIGCAVAIEQIALVAVRIAEVVTATEIV